VSSLLNGLRVLVLEDEFLIAMDVEQICRDAGARDVIIARTLQEADEAGQSGFDAAILDLMIGGTSTSSFAGTLETRGVPFVFASGYGELADVHARFPGVTVVPKPYSGDDLIAALASACGRVGPDVEDSPSPSVSLR
jgi:DNA-binding response OmpR family regulator